MTHYIHPSEFRQYNNENIVQVYLRNLGRFEVIRGSYREYAEVTSNGDPINPVVEFESKSRDVRHVVSGSDVLMVVLDERELTTTPDLSKKEL